MLYNFLTFVISQVRGQKKKIGWFPANYVKLLGSASARSTPEPSANAAGLTVSIRRFSIFSFY